MFGLLTSLLPGLLKIGDKMIEDKDKRLDFALKTQEMSFKVMEALLNVQTYKWVDALTKLAYSSEQIIKGLFRPVVSAGLFIYAIINPEILDKLHNSAGWAGDLGIAGMFGAFPAWMKSRHDEKKGVRKPPEDNEW